MGFLSATVVLMLFLFLLLLLLLLLLLDLAKKTGRKHIAAKIPELELNAGADGGTSRAYIRRRQTLRAP